MSFPFDRQRGLIIVRAEVSGPNATAILRLALDTGATTTLISQARLLQIGYDPALSPDRLPMTTGSGVEYVPRLRVSRIVTLGRERFDFDILAHTLPPTAGVDGLLSLDFLRDRILTIDFSQGIVGLR